MFDQDKSDSESRRARHIADLKSRDRLDDVIARLEEREDREIAAIVKKHISKIQPSSD